MNKRRVLALVTALTLLPAFSVGTAAAQQCTDLNLQTQPAYPGGTPSNGLSSAFAGSSNAAQLPPATVTRKGVYKLKSAPGDVTQFLQLLTGPGSPDRTDVKWGVTATDLGFAYMDNAGNTNLVFGDTFSCGSGNDGWRSNVILRTKDANYGDGLNLTHALTANGYTTSGTAKQFIPARHDSNERNREVTTIPTSAIVVNGVHYMDYMSVRKWAPKGGVWTTNYAATMKSTDGVNWTRVDSSVRKNAQSSGQVTRSLPGSYRAGYENLQMSAYIEDQQDSRYVYRFSTPNGRFGSAVLARALKTQFPAESAFEYWTGENWSKDAAAARTVLPGPVSELSVAYSSYLGKYVALYIVDNAQGGLVMKTADSLTGPWSEQRMLVSKSTMKDLYGGFILPKQDDQHLYYVATTWSGYNVFLMRTDLDRAVPNQEFNDGITIEDVVKVADLP